MAEDQLEEYKELSANLRHYGNITLTLISFYSAIAAGGAFVIFRAASPLPTREALLLKILALVVTIFFWVMEISAMYMWTHFIRRASALEGALKFQQYSTLVGAPYFCTRPATWAIHLFFLFFCGFWIATLVWL